MRAVLDRKKSAATIVAASERWAAATARVLEKLLRPELAEGETMPDLKLLQRLLGRALARRWKRLEAADQARERAVERRRRRRGEQLAARAKLYRRMVDLRRLLGGVFGGEACRRVLGIAGETSRDETVLLRQARHATACLADDGRGLPPAPFVPTADDLARWRGPIEAAAESLQAVSGLAADGGKDLEAAGVDLRRAIADYDSVFLRVAGLLGAAYSGAGRDQRAGAVRPSRRRLGRLLEDDDRGSRRRRGCRLVSPKRAVGGRTAIIRKAPGRAAPGRVATVRAAPVRVAQGRTARAEAVPSPRAEPLPAPAATGGDGGVLRRVTAIARSGGQ